MSSAGSKYNVRNPAVKRIMQEIKELQADVCGDFIADALEEDIFEWHFVIRGPPDTEFEGGIYHGRILLPADYPFKPPAFMMLTPNGRFQTNTKICLSISSHHPEHWQPSWSVRTALTALIAFMPTPGQGAIGSLDFTKEERMQLAVKSQSEPPRFGSAARQAVVDEMHTRFIRQQQSLAAAATADSSAAAAKDCAGGTATALKSAPADRDDQQKRPAAPAAAAVPETASDQGAAVMDQAAGSCGQQQQQPQQQSVFSLQQPRTPPTSAGGAVDTLPLLQQQQDSSSSGGGGDKNGVLAAAAAAAAQAAPPPAASHHRSQQLQQQPLLLSSQAAPPEQLQQQVQGLHVALGAGAVSDVPGGDRGLTFLIVVLSVAIAAMLLKKVVVAFAHVPPPTL